MYFLRIGSGECGVPGFGVGGLGKWQQPLDIFLKFMKMEIKKLNLSQRLSLS
jgi:hypothetical protein